KEEMGPDAVILKSRRTTRKLLGKTKACFEVTAALEESLFARPAPVPADRQAARETTPARDRASAAPGMYDWRGSLRRVDQDGNESRPVSAPDPREYNVQEPARRASAPEAARGGRNAGKEDRGDELIELLRSELKEMKERADRPTAELMNLKEEIRAMMESAASRASASMAAGSRQVEAKAFARQATAPSAAWIPHPGFQNLRECLVEMDMDPALASEAVNAAYSEFRSAAKLERSGTETSAEPGDRETALLARNLAERIRVTGGIRLRPGRPTTVALVGPTGVGKTTTLAKLAALAKLQQGQKDGIISADSFRMGANEQLELFGRTAGIPVKPVFSPPDVVQAQREFADCDLILVDTAGRSHTHKEMWRELQGLLHCLAPDEIHLVLSGPTRMRELWHQYGLYRDLGAGSIIFTKLDECLSLGCLYNLARKAEAPLSYLCNGQVIPDHIMLARTD